MCQDVLSPDAIHCLKFLAVMDPFVKRLKRVHHSGQRLKVSS